MDDVCDALWPARVVLRWIVDGSSEVAREEDLEESAPHELLESCKLDAVLDGFTSAVK